MSALTHAVAFALRGARLCAAVALFAAFAPPPSAEPPGRVLTREPLGDGFYRRQIVSVEEGWPRVLVVEEFAAAGFRVEAGEDPDLARRIAREAQRLLSELSREWLARPPPDLEDDPIRIRYALYPPGHSGGGGETTYVVGRSGPGGFAMSLRGDRETLLDSILPHELLHVLLALEAGDKVPHAINEGPPSTVESEATQEAAYDRPLRLALRTGRLFSLRDLLLSRTTYPVGDRVFVFYGQANSLAHFLIEKGGGGTAGRREIVRFMKSGARSGDWDAAFRGHYGLDAAGVELEWRTWMLRGRPHGAPPAKLSGV